MRLAALATALLAIAPAAGAQVDLRLLRDRVWFTPAPSSLDMQRLFTTPSEWPRALETIDVFKFYQGQVDPRTLNSAPNTYDALARAGAFARVTRDWKKRIAIEVGAVKEHYCTADASGMRQAIDDTQLAIDSVRAAGGGVSYLSLDEPFIAGLFPRCGGGRFELTADRLRDYVTAIRAANPAVRIGLIEAYPTFAPADFGRMLDLMAARGITPAFLHADMDVNALREGRDLPGRDLIALADLAASYRIPFGVIVWGHNGNSDVLYAGDARRLATVIHRTFRTWDVMPHHLIFQSWAESSTGLKITPANLPETIPDTHTALVNELYRLLRYGMVPRR